VCIWKTPKEKKKKNEFQIEINADQLSHLCLNCQQGTANLEQNDWKPVVLHIKTDKQKDVFDACFLGHTLF